MRLTGAQAVWESLVREGARTVFGISGGALIHLYHALLDYPIHPVLTRHEQAAAHAADGYARATGRVGVCTAPSGPGATNLVTGLATAYMDSSPVVAITGQVATPFLGADAFQGVDITGITLPITKHNYLVTDVEELPTVIKEAFHIARTGRPGPVLIDVAKDVQAAEIEYAYPEQVCLAAHLLPQGDPMPQVRRAAQMINDARQPLIIGGHGVVLANGYGSQGHAHALNLRDSGCTVTVGLHQRSKSWEAAAKAGLKVLSVVDAATWADVIMILVPDPVQAALHREAIAPGLVAGDTLMFAHGFNIRFHQIVPPPDVDVSMIAPKSPGHRLRELYQDGFGTPALLAVHQDCSGRTRDMALAYAKGIGCTRGGVIETTFAEETETDLFGEQAVLCGGVSELIKAGFETLVRAGYQAEIAYFECLHEMKLIVDLTQQGGLSYTHHSISHTAEHGDYVCGRRVITEDTRAEMGRILDEIRDGSYARPWILESQAGQPSFLTMRQREREHPIEQVGQRLRAMMPWLNPKWGKVMEDRVIIFDTTLRDGEQSPGAAMNGSEKVEIAHALQELGWTSSRRASRSPRPATFERCSESRGKSATARCAV